MPTTTSAQIRGARAMLGWSMIDLARAADVSVSTVKRIEGHGTAALSSAIRLTVVGALETAGVRFLDEDGTGAGLRLRPN